MKIKIDYNNIWYSFFKATEHDKKEYLVNVLKKKDVPIKKLKLKQCYTNWGHDNYFISFANNGENAVYDVKNDIIKFE